MILSFNILKVCNLEERITASVYDNIPVQALLDWVQETQEREVLALEDNVPGSLEECELELDKHEVSGQPLLIGVSEK